MNGADKDMTSIMSAAPLVTHLWPSLAAFALLSGARLLPELAVAEHAVVADPPTLGHLTRGQVLQQREAALSTRQRRHSNALTSQNGSKLYRHPDA